MLEIDPLQNLNRNFFGHHVDEMRSKNVSSLTVKKAIIECIFAWENFC